MLTKAQAEEIKIRYAENPKIGYRTIAKDYSVSWKVIFNVVKNNTYRPVIKDRFWSKVDIKSPDECWPWTASRTRQGYGHFGWNQKVVEASRVAYILTHGDPGDFCVLHSCDHPECCNPAHLRAGTHQDNSQDMVDRGRVSLQGRKLTMDQAREIRGKYKPYCYTMRDLQKDTMRPSGNG